MYSVRTENAMLSACVKACPTGAMSFGERNDILQLKRGESNNPSPLFYILKI
jgi:Fe-S-cluster-containing dehydrogenase component